MDKDYVAHISEKDIRILYSSTIGKHIIAPNYMNHPSVQIVIEQKKLIGELAKQGDCVIVGRCADLILKSYQKVIKDGSETRRAKFNMITSIIGGVLLCIGILLLVIKGMSVEYIDANGILHENFFLVPIGFMCIFCGLISFVSIGIRTIVIKIKDRND